MVDASAWFLVKFAMFAGLEMVDASAWFLVKFAMFAGLELVDVMRGHQATKSPDSSTEEGFAITSKENGMIKLVSVVFAAAAALVVSSASATEIDITKAVREAGKGTTGQVQNSTTGTNLVGYTVQNAFGDGEGKMDRIMLSKNYNLITWTIADDYEAGEPIVVTKYLIKRTSAQSETGSPYDVNRAPTEFYFQGSEDGTNWTTLHEIVTPAADKPTYWANEVEKTFEIDPAAYGSYRKYRFVTADSNATSGDSVKLAFQYIKLFGTVGDYGTLATSVRSIDHLLTTDKTGVFVNDYTPTLDSKIEVDVALNNTNGTQAIAVSGVSTVEGQMRLFYMAASGWTYCYGWNKVESGVKAHAGARYKIVIDGPKVWVGDRLVIDAGDTKTIAGGTPLRLFASPATVDDRNLYNLAQTHFWGLRAWTVDGTPALDLRPVVAADGGAQIQDVLTKKLYRNYSLNAVSSLPLDFKVHKWQSDFTANVRGGGKEPTVTLVEGSTVSGYSVTNVISTRFTSADRALFSTARNVIQYDIPDDYHPGYPFVLARYSITPPVYAENATEYTINRAPHHFELQASKDGVNDWVTLSKVAGVGCGPGAYARNGYQKVTVGQSNYYSYYGLYFDIPEEKRDDYRHYRLVTEKSSAASNDGAQIGFQELKLYGYDGGFETAYEPVEFVQNAYEKQKEDNTYFKTGVKPQACDLTVEMKGSFTDVSATSCLFCARDKDGKNTWTLFLINGALRLDCKNAGSASSFKPELNKVYTIKVAGNALYVDGNPIYTSGSTDFVPGSEICLLASHKAATGEWDNQARFKLQSCKITDSCGGVIRDYVAVQRRDGKVGLFERANDTLNTGFLASSGTDPRVGEPIDRNFWQRDREVTLATETPDGELPIRLPLEFAFTGNQRLSGELYAAFDEVCRGNTTNGWAEVVKIGDVLTGQDELEVKLPKSRHPLVKFFICDKMARNVSYTRAYKNVRSGCAILIR